MSTQQPKPANRPVSRDELHLAWAQVPNTAGIGGGFDAALKNKTIRRCLINMVVSKRANKREHTTTIFD
jgi:hypothetical protein